ncbi:MAG TPA: hypothetical protein VEB66_16670 [Opitutaceae bacterium]|nr:hypothetical protein [Opitutaceae bacterium]
MIRPVRQRPAAAYTLVEVMVASVVVLLGIVTAIGVLQRGVRSLDYARNLTSASQVMQSELEQLRLLNWTQIQALQDAGDANLALAGAASRYTCVRSIRTIKADMKEITLTATWRGADGREHTARLVTRYGRNGLNDFVSTAH